MWEFGGRVDRGTPYTGLLESQLRVREDRTREAGEKVRNLWHEIAAYEQDLADDLAAVREEYAAQHDLSADDAAAALRREMTPAIQQMEDAVDAVEQYFADEDIVQKPRNWQMQMPSSAAEKTYDGYNGRTAEQIIDRFRETAETYREQLQTARDRVESVKQVQTHLPAYIRGDADFDPVTVEESVTASQPEPADDNRYSRAELESALMEAYGRYLRDELGSYDAAHERVTEMVEEDLADWAEN